MGELLVGAMTWSSKAADLQRDPRYVLHSAVTGPDSGEREIKLYGSAVEAGQDLRGTTAGAWWSAWPPGKAIVFSLGIEQAVFIGWDTGHGLMTVHRWSPRSGSSQSSRARRCGSFGQGWVECVFAGNAGGNEYMIAISAAPGFAVLEWWLSVGIEVARVLALSGSDARSVIEPAG